MDDQIGNLDPVTVSWLLQGGDHAVRYHTLSGLLGAAPDDPEVAAARRAIMAEGTVPQILAAQGPDGHWGERDRFYNAKYRGTVWQLIILEIGHPDAAGLSRRAHARSARPRRRQGGRSGPLEAGRH